MFHPILKNISKHIRLTPEEEFFFTGLLVQTTLKRKEYLFREGQVVKWLTFVTDGCLRTYSIDQKGTEHTLLFAPDNWWCTDLFSFLSGKGARYNCDALKKTTIFQISREHLELLYEKVPKFERFFRILFQQVFIIQQNRIHATLSLNAAERIKRFHKTYPDLELRIAQKYIASYLNITPEFYSDVKSKAYHKK